MRTFSLCIAALALSGCAHTHYVYLIRNCATAETYDKFAHGEPPKVRGDLTGQADADTRPLAGSALELRGWGRAMLETIHVCSDAPDAHVIADQLLNDSK